MKFVFCLALLALVAVVAIQVDAADSLESGERRGKGAEGRHGDKRKPKGDDAETTPSAAEATPPVAAAAMRAIESLIRLRRDTNFGHEGKFNQPLQSHGQLAKSSGKARMSDKTFVNLMSSFF